MRVNLRPEYWVQRHLEISDYSFPEIPLTNYESWIILGMGIDMVGKHTAISITHWLRSEGLMLL